MSIKEMSKFTGLPKQTIRSIKQIVLYSDLESDKKDSNKKANLLESEFSNLIKPFKELISDLKPDKPETFDKIYKITYLLMARFSFDEIIKMLNEPALIAEAVESHIQHLSCGSSAYCYLPKILQRLKLNQIHDVFELGDKIEENLILPAETKPLILEIQKTCLDITDDLNVIKCPLSFLNSSFVEQYIISAEKLSGALTKLLANLELNVDLCTLNFPTYFEGNYLNYNSPAAAASDFMDEVMSKAEFFGERAWSVNELLNKLSFKEPYPAVDYKDNSSTQA